MDSLTGADVDINKLRNHPQLQQLQNIMTQKPALIQSLLEQFAAQNPEIQEETLIQLIQLTIPDDNAEGNNDDSPSFGVHTSEERKAIDQVIVLMLSGCAAGQF
jgi:UV excision repair protein RAD23